MKVKCQKCKGLIKDCPDCKNFKDTFDRLHEEAKKSATYNAEIHFLKVHEIISKLENKIKELEENLAICKLQKSTLERENKHLQDKLKEIKG